VSLTARKVGAARASGLRSAITPLHKGFPFLTLKTFQLGHLLGDLRRNSQRSAKAAGPLLFCCASASRRVKTTQRICLFGVHAATPAPFHELSVGLVGFPIENLLVRDHLAGQHSREELQGAQGPISSVFGPSRA